jgi:TolB protein
MHDKYFLIAFLFAVFGSFFVDQAYAIKIEINKGQIQPDPIAVVDFFGSGGKHSDLGEEVADIVSNDLRLSGLFVPLDSNSFVENPATLASQGHNIRNWNIIKARFLVYGTINESFGSFSVNFKLVAVVTGEIMLVMDISGSKKKLRKTAHVVADYIYERTTNEEGYFNTNLIIVETAGKVRGKRNTRLVKIDQDGYNPTELTDGKELALMARYSNDGKNIAYISYKNDAPRNDVFGRSAHVYIMNLETGRRHLLISEKMMRRLIRDHNGQRIQMTYAPHFSNDGTKAVLAIIIDGKSAIYVFDIINNELRQLTPHIHIDTSPCFSNDDSKIVFTSNREGKEAIFVMNADGSGQRRISKEGGKYSQPVWSPRGDMIAFTKTKGGQFFIGLMTPSGEGERLIANDYLVEAPCWASNGRYIAYASEQGPGKRPKIKVVDITGHHVRAVKTKGDATYPAWSPKLSVSEN